MWAHLITKGSVSPCTTSVANITTNVINKIRSRCGKACPSESTKGIDKAEASDTTPRIPDQLTRKGPFHPGLGSVVRIFLLIHRGTKVKGYTHITLIIIVSRLIISPYSIA